MLVDLSLVTELPNPPQRYVVHEQLGRGGMAVVNRAVDPQGRVVALKRLSPDGFDIDFSILRSFIEEARLAIRFHHVNIAKTYRLGKLGRHYFIEMEYLPGPTLLQLAMRAPIAGAMPIAVVIQILIQLCEALDYLHHLRDDDGKPLELVHRDVSMSNIIISGSGLVKLIDFGVVKGHSALPTQAGRIKGKLSYVAPEYLDGKIDSRADLFAVGVIAHELLTGRRLFYGDKAQDTLARLRTMEVLPPSRTRASVPLELDAIVMTALARDPDRRWQTAGEIRDALISLQHDAGDPQPIRSWVEWAFGDAVQVISELEHVIHAVDLDAQLIASESAA